jgi:O-antigen/teichoic acid export membrane protein
LNLNIFFGGAAAGISRVLSIGLGLALMPVLFRHLPRHELGVWLLFGQTWTALGVFDLGFGVIMTRRIAFAFGRSQSPDQNVSGANGEILDLVATGHRIYVVLAFCAFAISFGAGWLYLTTVEPSAQHSTEIWITWGVLCLGRACAIWTTASTCLMQGLGYVGWDTLIASFLNAVALVLQIGAVLLGFRMITLAGIAAMAALTQRAVVVIFLRKRKLGLLAGAGRWRFELFREMLPASLRVWLTTVGCLLVANSDPFFIASSQGASAIPSYRAAFVLIVNLHLIAGVFSAASPVFVSQLWQKNDLSQIKRVLVQNARIGLWTMACGAGAILSLGPTLFQSWLGPGNFIGYPVLVLFLVSFVLEHHANVFSTCARATGDEAYGLSSLGTGLLKLLLAWLLTRRFGLAGLAASTLLAQAILNDWFMVYRSVVRLKVNFGEHVLRVLVPCAGLFMVALCVGLLIENVFPDLKPGIRVLIVSSLAAFLLVASFWSMALESSQRSWLLRRTGLAWFV